MLVGVGREFETRRNLHQLYPRRRRDMMMMMRGELQTYEVNQSLCRQGKKMPALKKWNVGGVVILGSRGSPQKPL